MEQLNLDVCARKHGGCPTSVDADKRAPKAQDRETVLSLIHDAGHRGLTLKEACTKLGRAPNQISGRFTELDGKGGGPVYRMGDRRGGCFVWRVRGW